MTDVVQGALIGAGATAFGAMVSFLGGVWQSRIISKRNLKLKYREKRETLYMQLLKEINCFPPFFDDNIECEAKIKALTKSLNDFDLEIKVYRLNPHLSLHLTDLVIALINLSVEQSKDVPTNEDGYNRIDLTKKVIFLKKQIVKEIRADLKIC